MKRWFRRDYPADSGHVVRQVDVEGTLRVVGGMFRHDARALIVAKMGCEDHPRIDIEGITFTFQDDEQ